MPRPAAPPPPEPVLDSEDLTSRTDKKRANRVVEETLARLSLSLHALSPKRLLLLGLPEEVHEAVVLAQAMKDARARNRQLGRVRIELRNAEWGVIQERLNQLLELGTLPDAGEPRGDDAGLEAKWLARLMGEGFAGVDAFMLEFPRADRTRLEDLIHRVARSSHERRVRAERKLSDAIRSCLVGASRR